MGVNAHGELLRARLRAQLAASAPAAPPASTASAPDLSVQSLPIPQPLAAAPRNPPRAASMTELSPVRARWGTKGPRGRSVTLRACAYSRAACPWQRMHCYGRLL